MCGGIGYRLREETEFKPKPMVYVGDKPIVWHIMKLYSHYGFNEFVLALGYKADYIKEYFLNQKAFSSDFTLHTSTYKTTYHAVSRTNNDNFTITFVDTGLDTQIGERLLLCKAYIPESDSHFMMTYGDGVSNINISELVRFAKKQQTIATITGIHPRSRYGAVVPGKNNLVAKFTEKPVMNDWVNGGFMVLRRNFFDYLNSGENEHPAFVRLAGEKQLSLYQHEGFWYSIDTYKELEEINAMWKKGMVPWKVWK